jgi:sortase (surface protein transpeptidase)
VLLGLTACGTTAPQPDTAPVPSPAVRLTPVRTATPSATSTVPVRDADLRTAGSDRASRPARLVIGPIDLPVVPVGVTEDETMELPNTVNAIGWYQFGARPADRSGTTVLAGHVDTRKEGLGPLAGLRSVDRGAEIKLTAADGTLRRYREREVRVIRKSRLPLEQIFARGDAETLIVITCGGPYDRQTGYRDNVVLTARPVDG